MAEHRATLDKIKQVRARVEVSLADAKAALIASNGDIEVAVRTLMTPEQITRDRNAAIAEELVAAAIRRNADPSPSPHAPAPASSVARVVTMNSEALHAIQRHAPPLEPFLSAVHPACRLARIEDRWDRFGDGTSQRTTAADFVLAPSASDLEQMAAFTAKALQRRGLSRLPRDAEKAREAFLDGPACLRVRPVTAPLLDGVADALRIDVLVPSSDAAAGELIPPSLATPAAANGASFPTNAGRELLFEIGDGSLLETRHDATFRTRDNRVLALEMSPHGEIAVELR